MKPMVLMKKLAWTLGAMGILLIFIVFDWAPTIKDLSRLRREQHDEILKIKNFAVMTSSFVFPDAEEKSLFAQSNALLRRSLPQMYDNDVWLAMALLELHGRVKAEGIASARVLFPHQVQAADIGTAGPGRSAELADWLSLHYQDIQKSFQFTADPGRYPWYGVFSGLEALSKQRLASRELAVALVAPLPALLNFINRISWGETRLEIVCLYLEPGAALSQAWLICRGNYLVRKPSAWWAVPGEPESSAGNQLIDHDSPLLWQKVNREIVPEVSCKELYPVVSKPK
jgi:hypothetical protein